MRGSWSRREAFLACCIATVGFGGCGDDAGSAVAEGTSSSTGSTSAAANSTTTSSSTSLETEPQSTGEQATTTSSATTGTASDGTATDEGSSSGTTTGGVAEPCPRTPADPDASRFVVVSKPFDAQTNPANRYEVLELSPAGALTATEQAFEMGRVPFGEIAFSADGAIGMVAQDDGSVGVFGLDESGVPTVIEAGFRGSAYASHVVTDQAHERFFVLSTQTANNGGGVYEVVVGCDERVSDAGMILGASLVADAAWTSDGRVLLAAAEIGEESVADAFLYDGFDDPSLLGFSDAFGDDEAILSSAIVAAGGRVGILADTSGFSGIPNRLGVVRIDGDTVTFAHVVEDQEDPFDLVASPVDNTALMVSGFGDAVFVLDIDPESETPVSVRGELEYVGSGPPLPGRAVMIDRGQLEGLVLMAQNTGVRRIQFEGGGVVTDLGAFSFGTEVEDIVGAIGVQY